MAVKKCIITTQFLPLPLPQHHITSNPTALGIFIATFFLSATTQTSLLPQQKAKQTSLQLGSIHPQFSFFNFCPSLDLNSHHLYSFAPHPHATLLTTEPLSSQLLPSTNLMIINGSKMIWEVNISFSL